MLSLHKLSSAFELAKQLETQAANSPELLKAYELQIRVLIAEMQNRTDRILNEMHAPGIGNPLDATVRG